MSDKQVIILLGPPGSGKGTQGNLLAEKLGLYYFETSKILEDKFKSSKSGEIVKVNGQEYPVEKEQELWKKGVLCSPPFVTQLVKGKIQELAEAGESLLLSGSPRTLHEGEELMPLLDDLYKKENIRIILMDISAEETIFRNSHRRICQLMRHPILYSEETEKLAKCPIDGSDLLKREGLDDVESIKVRLDEFKNRTMPLVDFLRKQGYQISEVDGYGSVVEVFERNLKAIENKQ